MASRHSAGESSTHKSRSGRERSLSGFADEDLQRALALSLEENQQYKDSRTISEPPLVDRRSSTYQAEDDDSDLRAAIEASLREVEAPRPSAPPVAMGLPRSHFSSQARVMEEPQRPSFSLPNYDLDPQEGDAILTFSQTVDEVHAQGGLATRHGYNLNSLYDNANHARPKLAISLDDTDRKQSKILFLLTARAADKYDLEMLFDMSGKIAEAAKLYEYHLAQEERALTWRPPSYALPPQSPNQPSVSPTTSRDTALRQTIPQAQGVPSPRQERPQQVGWPNEEAHPAASHPWLPTANGPEHLATATTFGEANASRGLGRNDYATASVQLPQVDANGNVAKVALPLQPAVAQQPQQTIVAAMPPLGYTTTPASAAPRLTSNLPDAPHSGTSQYVFPGSLTASPIPNFPSVPSTDPRSYVNFLPPVQEPVERKEALLIEL